MTLVVLDFCGFLLPGLAASRLTGAGRSQNGQGPRPATYGGQVARPGRIGDILTHSGPGSP